MWYKADKITNYEDPEIIINEVKKYSKLIIIGKNRVKSIMHSVVIIQFKSSVLWNYVRHISWDI